MHEAGRMLRRARERLGLKYRDVEEASQHIATERASQEFCVGLSRLADIENKGTIPSIYRVYSLCAIYGLDFSTVLGWYGVNLLQLPVDAVQLGLPQTRPLRYGVPDSGSIEVPTEFVLPPDLQRTFYLSRHIKRWGKLPISLLNSLDLPNRKYALVGEEDWSMHPVIAPGALVEINDSKREVVNAGWMHESERPIYFVEDRVRGFCCRWCIQSGDFLVLQAHPLSGLPPQVLRAGEGIEVVGQVTAVAMRLYPVKRRRIHS